MVRLQWETMDIYILPINVQRSIHFCPKIMLMESFTLPSCDLWLYTPGDMNLTATGAPDEGCTVSFHVIVYDLQHHMELCLLILSSDLDAETSLVALCFPTGKLLLVPFLSSVSSSLSTVELGLRVSEKLSEEPIILLQQLNIVNMKILLGHSGT